MSLISGGFVKFGLTFFVTEEEEEEEDIYLSHSGEICKVVGAAAD